MEEEIIHMIIGRGKERGNGMGDSIDNGYKKKGVFKWLITFIVAVLVVGGSVAAYVMLNVSVKEKYFLAEKKSLEFMTEKFEERYQPELDWGEQTKKKPTASTITLSGEYNDPTGGGFGVMGPEQFINNSTIEIQTAADMKEQQIAAKLKANIGEMEIDDVNLYVNADKILFGLPFIDELLQVKGDDIGNILHELDPESYTGEEQYDLSNIFNRENGFLSEEDVKYLKKEYARMIYDELPDKAFDSSNDKIDVDNKSVKVEKLSFHLTEDEIKRILTKVLDKMEKDKKVKELLKDQLAMQFDDAMGQDIERTLKEFETNIADAKDGLKDLNIPDGFTSDIWVNDKLIVQRDFKTKLGSDEQDLITLTAKGTQLLKDKAQVFNYDLGYKDENDERTLNVSGDLAWKDNKGKDSINLTADDTVLSYEGSETLKDGKRDFDRTFSYKDPYGSGGSLLWNGNAAYEKDQMNAEHNLSIENQDIDQDMFSLQIGVDSNTTKKVEIPDDSNVKDLGSMSNDEITQYFNNDIDPSFQQWLIKLMGMGGFGL